MEYRNFIFLVVSPTMAVCMVILNLGIIIHLLLRVKKEKRRKFVYFINLALSDTILGLIVLLVKMMVKLEEADKKGGDTLLKEVRVFFQMKVVSLSLYISVLSIAAIIVERLILVMFPFYYTRLRYRTKCMFCVMAWITSTSSVTLMHFYVQNDRYEYILTPSLALSTIALATISFYLIRKQLFQHSMRHLKKITQAEELFTRFCFQTFLLFVVCWIPISIFGIMFSSGVLTDWEYLLEFRYTCHVIAFLNSLLSPLLFISQFVKRNNNKKKTTTITQQCQEQSV